MLAMKMGGKQGLKKLEKALKKEKRKKKEEERERASIPWGKGGSGTSWHDRHTPMGLALPEGTPSAQCGSTTGLVALARMTYLWLIPAMPADPITRARENPLLALPQTTPGPS
jgi:hypothetical protein